MKRSWPAKRSPSEGGDEAWLALVRQLPCFTCGRHGPNDAHHEVGAGRGKGQKAHDRRTLPLCRRCHNDFHALTGTFAYFTAEMRRTWQEHGIRVTALALGELLDRLSEDVSK